MHSDPTGKSEGGGFDGGGFAGGGFDGGGLNVGGFAVVIHWTSKEKGTLHATLCCSSTQQLL